MTTTEALVVSWRGQSVRVRHDDPRLGEYTPGGAVIRNAMHLASDVRGLQLALDACVGDCYSVKVAERPEGVAIGLRRLVETAVSGSHE
jgi:hypothetical protein